MTQQPTSAGRDVVPTDAVKRLVAFITQSALPLWSSSGFDARSRRFEERLSFEGAPVTNTPLRMMVQARQIVSYARCSIAGWYDNPQCAIDAFESACNKYYSPDGRPGWAFSLHPNGEIADPARDLYTHAFIIYMLAWMFRLTGDSAILARADSTLSDIDKIFAAGEGPGLLSKVPGRSDLREQNPHMHLFEALLTLAEFTGNERHLERAGTMVALFDHALADPATGAVREVFAADWRPVEAAGSNLIEPGHQMEWSWLLRHWQRLSGVSVEDRVQQMMTHATRFGIDAGTGLVRSSVREDGTIVSNASRVWPQTEAIRALCREDAKGAKWGLVPSITKHLFAVHLPSRLNGGWIDQVDAEGKPLVDYMPASSLYHLIGAAIDGEHSLKG